MQAPTEIPREAGRGGEPEPAVGDRLLAVAAGREVPAEVHDQVLAESPVLEIDRFNLWYGAKQAIHSITMPIPINKVTALVGPSGCGKSTLLRSVNRLNDLVQSVRITGDMRLNGDSIYDPRMDVIDLRKRMGMVFQKPNPFPMSIYENVVYSLRIDGENNRGVLDEVCELSLRGSALWDEVKDRLNDSALGLSGGQQQRLCIARAIAAEPEVLLLDEPMAGVPSGERQVVLDALATLPADLAILMIEQDMDLVFNFADRMMVLAEGAVLAEGSPAEIRRHPAVRAAYLGEEA